MTHYKLSALVKALYPPMSPEGIWLGKETVDGGIHSLQVNSLQLPGHGVLRSSQENKTSLNLHFNPYPKSPFLRSRVPCTPSSQMCAGTSLHNSDISYAFLRIKHNNHCAELLHHIDMGDMPSLHAIQCYKAGVREATRHSREGEATVKDSATTTINETI